MIDPDLKDLWTPTGLLLGFQVTLFKWRLEREAEVGDKGDIPWLVPADYVSILGMLTLYLEPSFFRFQVSSQPALLAVHLVSARCFLSAKPLVSLATISCSTEAGHASSSGSRLKKKSS